MEVKQKKILGVDFDDVLFQCNTAAAKFHNTTYGTSYSRDDVKTFDWRDVWHVSPEEEHRRVLEFFATKFHDEAEAVIGAYDALKKLNEAYEVVIVTGRPESARDVTLEWLSKHFLGLYREVHFTSHYDSDHSKRRKKSDIVKELGINIFIEDALHFAADVAESGIPVFLIDTPWNQGETPPNVTRVYSWDEILEKLLP